MSLCRRDKAAHECGDVRRGYMEPKGRVVASDRKRSRTLARGANLRRGGRRGSKCVGFQSLRPCASAARLGTQGINLNELKSPKSEGGGLLLLDFCGSVRNEWETEQEIERAQSAGKRRIAGKRCFKSVESAHERTSTDERGESRKNWVEGSWEEWSVQKLIRAQGSGLSYWYCRCKLAFEAVSQIARQRGGHRSGDLSVTDLSSKGVSNPSRPCHALEHIQRLSLLQDDRISLAWQMLIFLEDHWDLHARKPLKTTPPLCFVLSLRKQQLILNLFADSISTEPTVHGVIFWGSKGVRKVVIYPNL
ncbi:hypothetical protein EDB92DRAFT_1969921 [Lactarius akahatsu]|uniref:Uncharacterized protein n=1 Tax=Lactarius akahatsu TaxID=416441 RepID=A0AAD4Q948_9AGAM|nr:hypothetical protein EDB92DRAFT_1969921 [Lactarius akahatsu]